MNVLKYRYLIIALIIVIFSVQSVGAEQPGWMFHADAQHTGVYDDGGIRPGNSSLWNFTTFGSITSSPAVANGVVYVGSWDHKVYALNAVTGVQAWNFTTGGDVWSSSPAVANGVVYVGSSDNKVYALNAVTGVQAWNFTTGNGVSSSPTVANGVVYVGSNDGKIYALNAANGALVWNFTTGNSVLSSPAVANGVVYFGSRDHKVYALNASTGARAWNFTTGSWVDSSPAVVNGVVYVGSSDNKVYALNAVTGAQVWNFTTGDVVYSSPAVANGVVYVGSWDHKVYAINAANGASAWNFTTGNYISSSPAVANGVVYIGGSDDKVYALNAVTGAQEWNFTTGGGVISSPAVTNGVVYIGTLVGKVYAIGSSPSVPPASITNLHNTTYQPDYITWTWTDPGSASFDKVMIYLDGVFKTNISKGVQTYTASSLALDTQHTIATHTVGTTGQVNQTWVNNTARTSAIPDAKAWKFRSDLHNSGVYDNGGIQPGSGEVWNFTTGYDVDSSPVVVNGIVYVGSFDKKVYALNASTGIQVWNFTTGHWIYSSPAVANGVVYIGSRDNKTYALNAASGAELWNITTGSYVYSSPVVADGIIYIGSDDNKIYALNATNGVQVWNFTTGNYVESSPAVANGVIYIGSGDHKVYALNAATGAEAWNFTTGSVVRSSPAVVNGVVYVGSFDNKVYALNAVTGAQVWNFTTGNVVYSCPAVVNGFVYVGSHDHKVYALNAATGTQVWNFTTGDSVHSSPAVANGVVYVGSRDHKVYALNAATGTQVWNFTTGDWVWSSPAVANGVVYIGSDDHKVYAIGSSPSVPPASIINLHNTTYAQASITWAWTDPASADFDKVMVYLDGIFQTNITKGTQTYTASSLTTDTQHTVSTHTVGTTGLINQTWVNSTSRTAPIPPVPPASVTNLHNTTYQQTSISWSWTDPGSFDFDHVMVYIDGVFKSNVTKGSQTYTASPLTPDTLHTIATHTVGTTGMINQTWVNSTATTAPIPPVPPASITGLHNFSYQPDYITWTWTDPGSASFDKVMVYLDGVFQANITKGTQTYTASSLALDTQHTIATHTVGSTGSINQTWVNHTARTSAIPDAKAWKFRSDLHNSGVYEDGGIQPGSGEIWNFTTGFWVDSSPAIANGIVYVGSQDSKVYAINAATGAQVWNFTTGEWLVSSPAVANGVVYIGSSDGKVYAINAASGTQVWNFTTGDWVTSSPAVANDVIYIGSRDSKVYAINSVTGAQVWNFTTGSSVRSSPAVANGIVYVGSDDGKVYAINSVTGAQVWNFTTIRFVYSSPAIANGIVYVGSYDGNIYAINATTGAEVWNFNTGGGIYPSPAVANGIVYVGSEDSKLYALNAATGAEAWNFTTGGYIEASPGVANGFVYVGSWDQKVYALNAVTGAEVWNFTTGEPVDSSPAVANGVVYVGSGNKVYAIGSTPPVPPASIANLHNTTYAQTIITWVWTDPSSVDFDKVMVYLNGTFLSNVTKGTQAYTASGLTPATGYTISTHTIGTTGLVNATWVNHTAKTAAIPPVPPASITNLHNTTYAQTSIIWVWTDPSSADFDKVMVYLNGTFKANVTKGTQAYMASSLTPATGYTISTHTFGTTGLVNATWVNHTATTAAIPPVPPASITNLHNTTYLPTSITWAWTDPGSADFDKVMVYLNGTFQSNVTKGTQTYTASSLTPATGYTISTHTVGTSGLVNNTWVNDTVTTASGQGMIVPLQNGWNIFSTPILLDPAASDLDGIFDQESISHIDLVLGYDGTNWFIPNESYHLVPLNALYIKVNGSANALIVPSSALSSPPSRDLPAGASLIAPAPGYVPQGFPPMPLDQAFISIYEAPGGRTGYTMIISPGLNQPGWGYARGGTTRDILPFKGYWVVMENPDTLYGFSTTPV